MTTARHRVAIYGRFSSERQTLSSSEDQLRLCDEKARYNGWIITHRFSDDAISGTENNRPGYQGLKLAVQNGDVDIVLTESLSRLSRDMSEIAAFFDQCQFREIKIVTLSDGEITRMHVGMLGTMNAMYLDNLAETTYRGIASRVAEGKFGGGRAYGYRSAVSPSGVPLKGQQEINPDEAAVVVRIMTEYSRGISPAKIAEALNAEGIPSPHGKDKGETQGDGKWAANAIYGNRQRGTGILNNELYVGRRIWNRLRFVKQPGTKKRISRLNPESEWKVVEAPHLRIVSDELWAAVRARLAAVDAIREANQAEGKAPLSGSRAIRRPTYLLSGLIRCGSCGGTMNVGGSNPKRYFCRSAREKGKSVCKGVHGIAKDKLEALVLNGIRTHLMQPEAVAEFMRHYQKEAAERNSGQQETRKRLERSLARTKKDIANIIKAIKGGLAIGSIMAEAQSLEARKVALEAELLANAAPPMSLPVDLADVYRSKVESLVASLNDPETLHEAQDAVRGLIDKIVVHWDAATNDHAIEIVGELAALLGLGTNENAAAFEAAARSFEVVAGAGFEPATFRL